MIETAIFLSLKETGEEPSPAPLTVEEERSGPTE
jgi:hypothetical protein